MSVASEGSHTDNKTQNTNICKDELDKSGHPPHPPEHPPISTSNHLSLEQLVILSSTPAHQYRESFIPRLRLSDSSVLESISETGSECVRYVSSISSEGESVTLSLEEKVGSTEHSGYTRHYPHSQYNRHNRHRGYSRHSRHSEHGDHSEHDEQSEHGEHSEHSEHSEHREHSEHGDHSDHGEHSEHGEHVVDNGNKGHSFHHFSHGDQDYECGCSCGQDDTADNLTFII